jgi:hypothetical protein
MGRSAARFDAKNCSNFAHNGFGEMGVCCQGPIRIAHLKDLLPLPITPAFHALRRCPSRVARRDRSEIRHRKLRYDFRFWKFGYVWNAKVGRTSLIAGVAGQAAGGLHPGHMILIPSKVVPILRVAFALGRRGRIAPCPHSGLTRLMTWVMF